MSDHETFSAKRDAAYAEYTRLYDEARKLRAEAKECEVAERHAANRAREAEDAADKAHSALLAFLPHPTRQPAHAALARIKERAQ